MAEFLHETTGNGDVLDVPRTFEAYEVLRTISIGPAGAVFEVQVANGGAKYAAKFMKSADMNDERLIEVEHNLRSSMNLSCPHLVKYYDVIRMNDMICLIMEFCEGGNLFDTCRGNMAGVYDHWQKIFTHVCSGVKYLHEKGLSHRSIKLENVLVDKDFNCKVADYGMTCEMDIPDLARAHRGTVPYMAPEVVRGDVGCVKKADVWSLGVLLFTTVSGRFPWKSMDDARKVGEILAGTVDTRILPEDVREVVSRCCDPNPEHRATLDQLLAMPFAVMPVSGTASALPVLHAMGSMPVVKHPLNKHLSELTRRARIQRGGRLMASGSRISDHHMLLLKGTRDQKRMSE